MALRFDSGWATVCAMVLFAVGQTNGATPRVHTPEFETESWTSEKGLPDDSVISLQQTAEGFLWVGTAGGLARFDGWTFAPVLARAGSGAPKRQPFKITAQCVDGANQLWFGRPAGTQLFPGLDALIRQLSNCSSQPHDER
jgi:ligand-binding sensor domain-containing protein